MEKGKREMKYKTIPNTGRKYCAGEDGHIYRMRDLHRLAERLYRNQYCVCNLFHNGVSHTFCVHRLVAQAWCDDLDNGKHIHHINKNTKDNRPYNLQCLTPLEHMTLHYGELPEWRVKMLEEEYLEKKREIPQNPFSREKRKEQLQTKKRYREKAKSKESKCLLMSNKIKNQIQEVLQLEKQKRNN